jgi:hypothetical protein
MRRELARRAIIHEKRTQVSVAPSRALAVGAVGLGCLLAAYSVTDETSFGELPAEIKDFLVASALAHSGCMRFGHFSQNDRPYRCQDFTTAPHKSWRLQASWKKYEISAAMHGTSSYSILFSSKGPAYGTSSITAAMLLSWQMRGRAQSEFLFRTASPDGQLSRSRFQAWMRLSFAAALPLMSREQANLLSPHSFRAGRASDLWRSKASPETIRRAGRWASSAFRLYIRDGFLELVNYSRLDSIVNCEQLLEAL